MSKRHWIDRVFDFIFGMWSADYRAENLRFEELEIVLATAEYEQVEREMWAAELRQWDCAFKQATGMDYLPWEQRPTHTVRGTYDSFFAPGCLQALNAALQNQQASSTQDFLAQQAQRFPGYYSQQQLGAFGSSLGGLSNPLLDALRGFGPKKGPPSGSQ